MHRSSRPLHVAVALGAALGLVATGLGALPATASPWDLQARIGAAPAGSTLRLPPGVLKGGVTIAKSLTLVGAGTSRTVIKGGDSVVRIASPAGVRPTVTISDLTITGGVARGSAERPSSAYGGGLFVEPQGQTVGADVLLRHVVVSENRAEPSGTVPSGSGFPCPGGTICPYAIAAGGGIASFGNLVLSHSVVRGNRATGYASDAAGGGIWTALGHLQLLDSTVTGNLAVPLKIGRYAEGGGVFTEERGDDEPRLPLTVRRSSISGNTALLRTSWPVFPSEDATDPIGMGANAGGLHIGRGYDTVVDRSRIDDNAIIADDPIGEPFAFDSGIIQVDSGSLVLSHSSVSRNSAKLIAATADQVGVSGSVIEIDATATITDSVIRGNAAEATGVSGSAVVSNGLILLDFGDGGTASVQRTLISGNTATARATGGSAQVLGAGVFNNGTLTLDRAAVVKNRGKAVSADATAQGGGIWNASYFTTGSLTAHRSVVAGNSVVAAGGTAQGGGLYSGGAEGSSYSLDRTPVVGNAPDQIFDTATAAATKAATTARTPLRVRPAR